MANKKISKIVLFFLLLIIFACLNVFAKKLKKYEKELAIERLDIIESKIKAKDYEIALNYLVLNADLFKNSNLPKKTRNRYWEVKEILDPIKLKFEENERKVNTYYNYYEEKEYYAAIGIFDLDINEHNSYLRTIEFTDELKENLKNIKKKCEDYKKRVYYIKSDFRIKNWESIFEIYESTINTEGEFLSLEDKEKVLILMKMITPHYGFYKYNRDKIIKPLHYLLDSICTLEVNSTNANELLNLLNIKYIIYDTDRLSDFPKLESKYHDLLILKEKKAKSIKEFISLENKKKQENFKKKKSVSNNKSITKGSRKSISASSKFVLTHMLGKKLLKTADFYIGSQKVWVLDFNNGDKIEYTILSFKKNDHFRGIKAVDNFGDVVIIDIIKRNGRNTVIEIKYNAGTITYSGYYQK